jgi:hypothetical protein
MRISGRFPASTTRRFGRSTIGRPSKTIADLESVLAKGSSRGDAKRGTRDFVIAVAASSPHRGKLTASPTVRGGG